MSINKKNNYKNTEFYRQYLSVLKWNNDFGVKMYEMPVNDITTETINYRFLIIKEEVRELNDGLKNKNIIEVWDAVSDILVTLYGALGSFGYLLDFSKVILYNGEFADIYNKPLKDLFTNPESLEKITKCVNSLNDQLSMLELCCSKRDLEKASEVIHLMIRTTMICSYWSNLDPNKGLEIVQKSNFTKSCKTKEEALDTLKSYKIGENIKTGAKTKKVKNPGYKKSDNGSYIIYCKDTKKILKGINFVDADFSKHLIFSNK